MSDEELMHIAFADKRTVQEILRSIFDIGVQQGKTDAIDEVIKIARAEIDFQNQAEQKRFVEFMESLKEQKKDE